LRNWAWSTSAGAWKLAIGIAAGVRGVAGVALEQQPLFSVLAASLRDALHPGFAYRLHLVYDSDDAVYADATNRAAAGGAVMSMVLPAAAGRRLQGQTPLTGAIDLSVHWQICGDCSGKPARAHSNAAVAAVMEGAEYVFRVNDDTGMPPDASWTQVMIDELTQRRPVPNLGVTGPDFEFPVETPVLSHDFTHRLHIATHGWHYPPSLPDW